MNEHDRDHSEQKLASLLIAYDEALDGDDPSEIDVSQVAGEDLQQRFDAARECVDLLARVRQFHETSTHADSTQPLASHGEAMPASPPVVRRIGRFNVERELGRGGLGVVYLATDPELGRQVALKVPRADALTNAEVSRRFLREAEAAARLSHPHLVGLHEVGRDQMICFIVSEYCPGTTLAEWLRRQAGPVPFRQAALLVLRVAEGVQHAHGRGVLHRDIKPSNVLMVNAVAGGDEELSREGLDVSPKLTDFGMAKLLEQERGETRTGAILGTLAYMSPEQAEGHIDQLDARTDVYSLGAMLYELLTGVPPFAGRTDADTLRQLVTNEPRAPRQQRADVPRDLESIALRALANRPADRFDTAHEFAADLRRYLSGQPTLTRPLAALERSWRWVRRRPAVAALIGVVCASAIGLVVMTTVYNARLGGALDDSRRLLYAADMNLAFDAWRGNHAIALSQRLDRYGDDGPSDLRTFPWHFLSRQRSGDQTNIYAHADVVFAVAWSPDGKLIATGSDDADIRLWDVAEGKIRKIVRGHRTNVNDLAFSPDSRLLASCGDDLALRIWEIDKDAPPRVMRPVTFRDLNGIAFSPDGKWLAAGGEDQKTRIWDTSDWKLAKTLSADEGAVNRVAFSPDSRRLAVTHSAGLGKIFDVSTGQVVVTLDPKGSRSTLGMSAVTYSHDGRLVAAASFRRQEVDLWEADTGKRLKYLTNDGNWLHTIAFSPDDRRLYTGNQDGTVRIWDVETYENLHVLLGHTDTVRDLAISPTGQSLVTVGADRSVKLWDLPAIDHRQTRWNLPKSVRRVAFSPLGNLIAFEELYGPMRLVDTATRAVQFESTVSRDDAVAMLAFSPDGKCLAFTTGDGRAIELLDLATCNPIADLRLGKPRFECLAFSPLGDVLATGDDKSGLTFWNVPSGRKTQTHATGQGSIQALAYISGGDRVVVAGANDTRVWDARTLKGGTLLPTASKKLVAFAVSPDETLLAGGSFSGEVFVWEVASMQLKAVLVGHSESANSVAFSRDGNTLASAGGDGTVRLWDMRTLQDIGVIFKADEGASPCETVAFAPDGRTLAVGGARPGAEGMLRIWSLDRGLSRDLGTSIPLPAKAPQK